MIEKFMKVWTLADLELPPEGERAVEEDALALLPSRGVVAVGLSGLELLVESRNDWQTIVDRLPLAELLGLSFFPDAETQVREAGRRYRHVNQLGPDGWVLRQLWDSPIEHPVARRFAEALDCAEARKAVRPIPAPPADIMSSGFGMKVGAGGGSLI